jgi:hypothetical protein
MDRIESDQNNNKIMITQSNITPDLFTPLIQIVENRKNNNSAKFQKSDAPRLWSGLGLDPVGILFLTRTKLLCVFHTRTKLFFIPYHSTPSIHDSPKINI